ncbi:MAG: glycosyltransferase family 2 protein [Chthonomonadales bacterium]
MPLPMTLSIILVNWNTRDYLLGALHSIYRNPPPFEFEVIVVDNASADGSAEAVARKYPQVCLIANNANEGYARGNNQGVAASRGRYVLLLNPDVVVWPGSLERAVELLERRPEVGVLAAKLVHPDGTVQKSVRGFPRPAAMIFEVTGIAALFRRSRIINAYRMDWFDYEHEAVVEQPMGTFLLMRRSVFDRIGAMDECFPIFFNDVDWLYRANRNGVVVLYTPSVVVTHYGGGSTRLVRGMMAWESRRGLLQFYRKHYRSPLFLPVYWVAALASWVHAWIAARLRG